MTLYQFCKCCHGINKQRCWFCSLTITDYRKISESQVNHHLYLRATWARLKRFDMLTTGIFALDEQLYTMWGFWRSCGAAESLARDVLRGKPFPEHFRNTKLGEEIEKYIASLSLAKLNGILEPQLKEV